MLVTLDRYFGIKKRWIFLLVVISNFLISWLSVKLFMTEDVFYNTYNEQLTYERAIKIFNYLRQVQWIGYVFIPISFIIKAFIISIVVFIGVLFTGNYNKGSLEKIFSVVIASEIVFVFAGLIKLSWLFFFNRNYDLNQLNFYYPLSLGSFFSYKEVAKIWILPLQGLSLFQVAYILMLSYGTSLKLALPLRVADKAIIISYLPCYLLLMILFMFLSIGEQ